MGTEVVLYIPQTVGSLESALFWENEAAIQAQKLLSWALRDDYSVQHPEHFKAGLDNLYRYFKSCQHSAEYDRKWA